MNIYRFIIPIIVILTIACVYINIVASPLEDIALSTSQIKQDSLSGIIEINKERTFLVMGKEKIQLAMIPPAAMDSLNFHPQENDILVVKGINSKGILVVSKAWLKDTEYTFRDSAGLPLWKETAAWTINPKACIGCRLCVSNCPANAIVMVKNKAVIDQTKCTGCNICIVGNQKGFAGCPVRAITK